MKKEIYLWILIACSVIMLTAYTYKVAYTNGLNDGRLFTIAVFNGAVGCVNMSCVTLDDVNQSCQQQWFVNDWSKYKEWLQI